jgi:uncharacterized protein (DUF1778 family)
LGLLGAAFRIKIGCCGTWHFAGWSVGGSRGDQLKRPKPAPTERLEARVPRSLKQTLQKAAAVTGHSTLTSYVVYALQTSAQAVIDEHERIRLSAEESNRFVETLLSPPPPNGALKAAFSRYRKVVAGA